VNSKQGTDGCECREQNDQSRQRHRDPRNYCMRSCGKPCGKALEKPPSALSLTPSKPPRRRFSVGYMVVVWSAVDKSYRFPETDRSGP
jgi:hypothetical protein